MREAKFWRESQRMKSRLGGMIMRHRGTKRRGRERWRAAQENFLREREIERESQ